MPRSSCPAVAPCRDCRTSPNTSRPPNWARCRRLARRSRCVDYAPNDPTSAKQARSWRLSSEIFRSHPASFRDGLEGDRRDRQGRNCIAHVAAPALFDVAPKDFRPNGRNNVDHPPVAPGHQRGNDPSQALSRIRYTERLDDPSIALRTSSVERCKNSVGTAQPSNNGSAMVHDRLETRRMKALV